MRFSNIVLAVMLTLFLFPLACTETKVVPGPATTTTVTTTIPGTTGNDATAPETPDVPNTPDTKVKDLVKDIVAPTVVTVNPADESTGAALATEVSATFSEDINPDTVSVQSFHVKDSAGVPVEGVVSYDTVGKVATFKPSNSLVDSESYSVTITPEITDLSGNPLPITTTTTFKADKTPVIALCGGWSHTAAVKKNGTLWTWGRNHYGQLGDGTLLDRNKPTRVKELSNVEAVACGMEFTMARLKDGTVWAWGANHSGQLGDGTTTNHLLPTQVLGLSDVTEIGSSLRSGFALKKDGTVWSWGSNSNGQLGDGTTIVRLSPVQVSTLANVKSIAVGQNYAMALGVDPNNLEVSRVYAWGGNYFGQLGKGSKSRSSEAQSTPIPVLDGAGQPLTDIRVIASSGLMSFAITKDNRLLGWGYRGAGNGTTVDQPFAVEIMKDVQDVSRGVNATHAFAITTTGELWGWGNNNKLQLMIYDPEAFIISPMRIGVVDNVKAVVTGVWHTILLKNDESVASVGSNIYGELGDGSASFYNNHPNKLATMPPSKQISGRSALTKDGKVWAWGRNVDCELGLANEGAEIMVPVPIKGIPDTVTQISRSTTHMLALTDKGEVWAWGSNVNGQLGTGLPNTEKKSCRPTKVKTPDGIGILNGIDSVYATNYFSYVYSVPTERSSSFALQKDAQGKVTVLAWGNNSVGQLGNGRTGVDFNALPQVVLGLPDNVVEISGRDVTYARTSDGKVFTMMTTPSEVPLNFGSAKVDKIIRAGFYSVVLLDNHQVWTWGNTNYLGQLGSNQSMLSGASLITTPLQIPGIENAVDVVADGYNGAIITADKKLYVWGNNNVGQLGDGTSRSQAAPVILNKGDGQPLENIQSTSFAMNGVYDWAGVQVVLQTDGSVWDWGFLNVGPTLLIREGEPSFRSTPTTVNWP